MCDALDPTRMFSWRSWQPALKRAGPSAFPHVIPGGPNALGALGYVESALEIARQCSKRQELSSGGGQLRERGHSCRTGCVGSGNQLMPGLVLDWRGRITQGGGISCRKSLRYSEAVANSLELRPMRRLSVCG